MVKDIQHCFLTRLTCSGILSFSLHACLHLYLFLISSSMGISRNPQIQSDSLQALMKYSIYMCEPELFQPNTKVQVSANCVFTRKLLKKTIGRLGSGLKLTNTLQIRVQNIGKVVQKYFFIACRTFSASFS